MERAKTQLEMALEEALAAERARADIVAAMPNLQPAGREDLPTWIKRHGRPLTVNGRTLFPDGAMLTSPDMRTEPAGENEPVRHKTTQERRQRYWRRMLELAEKEHKKLTRQPEQYGREGFGWLGWAFGPAPPDRDRTGCPCVRAAVRRLEEVRAEANAMLRDVEQRLAASRAKMPVAGVW